MGIIRTNGILCYATGGHMEELKSIIERYRSLIEQRESIAEDIEELTREVKAHGFDMPTIKKVVKLMEMESDHRRSMDLTIEAYRAAVDIPVVSNK
jgi:uncharacterized protein (UPF0335 family)